MKKEGSQCEVDGLTHYQRNKEQYILKNKELRTKRLEFVNSLKNKPCTDCGIKYPPYVMEFDHLGNEKKFKEISVMVRQTYSEERILNEIKKCELVCSNCHRQRTYDRYQASLA